MGRNERRYTYERLRDEIGQVFPGHWRSPHAIGSYTLALVNEQQNDQHRTVWPTLGFRIVNELTGEIDTEHCLDRTKPDWKMLRAALRESREHMLDELGKSLQVCGVALPNQPPIDPRPSVKKFHELSWGPSFAVLCGVPGKALQEMTQNFLDGLRELTGNQPSTYKDGDIPVGRLGGAAAWLKERINKGAGACVGIYPNTEPPPVFRKDRPARVSQQTGLPFLLVCEARRFPNLTLDQKMINSAEAIYWAENHEGLLTVVKNRQGPTGTFRMVA